MDLRPLGDRALMLRGIASSKWKSAERLAGALRQGEPAWVEEVIPAFDTIAIVYDPLHDDALNATRRWLLGVLQQDVPASMQATPRTITIPVRYGGKGGPDLKHVAERLHIGIEEVIRLHSEATYDVLALGFLPGFGYLGGLPRRLVLARRDSVRQKVAPGSVAIGGPYTGVYPFESPGGWHLIGQTSLPLFNLREGSLLRVGDRVRFLVEGVDA